MSHYELNQDVNLSAGNVVPESSLEPLRAALLKQLGIIKQEQWELRTKGIAANYYKEIRDGVGDAIVVWDGFIHYASMFVAHPGDVSPTGQSTVVAVTRAMERLDAIHLELTGKVADGRYVEEILADDARSRQNLQDLLNEIYANIEVIADYYRVPVMLDQYTIFDSNMSKFDTDLTTAEAGKAKYEAKGIQIRIEETQHKGVTYYILKSALTQVVDGVEYVEGKFLKSVNFFKPKFEDTHDTLEMTAYLEALGNPETAQAVVDAMQTEAEPVGGITDGLEAQIADVKSGALQEGDRDPERDYYELKINRANGEEIVYRVNLPATAYDGELAAANFAATFHEIEQARLTQFMDEDKRFKIVNHGEAIAEMLRYANLMAAIKNLTGRRQLNIKLDPNDPDPVGTIQFLVENLNNTVDAAVAEQP